MWIRARWVAFTVAVAFLHGCGGGGDEPPPPTPTHTVGGAVSGLAGSGLVLALNGTVNLAVGTNGSFTFPGELASGSSYAVTVKTQPASPNQTCAVTSSSGTVGSNAVADISVGCTNNNYAVGGTVGGLAGSGLVLQLNGTSDLAVGPDGIFDFPGGLGGGSTYGVTVKTQPVSPYQTCVTTNPSGVVGSSAVSVSVSCTTNSYSVDGSVTGLTGSGLVLRLNGGQDLPVSSNGAFSFPTLLPSGSQYALTVKTQPTSPSQTCVATNPSGVMGGSAASVAMSCTTNSYSVGGSVTGLTGSDLVLQLNGGQNLTVSSNGSFVFPGALPSGSSYTVTIKSQTTTYRELCAASKTSGVVAASNISTVEIDCTVVAGFVYVVGSNDQVSAYAFHPQTGALFPLGPVATVGSGTMTMVAAPNAAALYASDRVSSKIYAFSVDSSKGTLTAVGAPISTGTPGYMAFTLAIAPSGKFLYAGNSKDGTVTMFSIDPATGALTAQGVVASVTATGNGANLYFAVTPDGAFLYLLSFDDNTPASVTAYSINATTGALTAGATIAPGVVNSGLTIDSLGRFLYLRRMVSVSPYISSTTTLYPFSIDSGTGALTPVNVPTSVSSNGSRMLVEPSGRYAYLLNNFNFVPADNHVDAFSIDQATGALTTIGTPALVQGVAEGFVCDASGKFIFVGSATSPGAFDPSATSYGGSTFVIGTAGPTAGQLSAAGLGAGLSATSTAIAVIQ